MAGGGRGQEQSKARDKGLEPLDNKARVIVKYLESGFLYVTYVLFVTKKAFSKENENPNKDDQRKKKRRNRLPENIYYQ
jgi:hypothetical protein